MIKTGNEEKYVLDTSACLAFLEDEEVPLLSDKKKEGMSLPLSNYYRNNDCGIPKRDKRQREEVADKRYAMLKSLGAEFLWEIDESILITAGRFKGQYRLSLADAIIAAFAKKEGAVLVHKDPEFDLLKKEVSQLALPKK